MSMKKELKRTTILLIEDDEHDRRMLLESLRDKYFVEVAIDYTMAKEKINKCQFDVVFLDLMLPNRQGDKIEESGKLGLYLLKLVREKEPLIPIVVISALTSVKMAMKILREGIVDFIVKDDLEDQLPIIMRRAELIKQGYLEHLILRHESRIVHTDQRLVYVSSTMTELMDQVKSIARSDASVLLTGETGTGKELIAREFHARSPRSESPFIALNCAAIPEGLLESELFGYEKGAFTGADRKKIGVFELANNGTLFLDEVTEMSHDLQVKLLRVLQEYQMRRVGGEKLLSLNIRVIAATNKDIQEEIKAGRFREDLYFRISVVPLSIPPLRLRLEDIEILADHFVKKYSTASKLSLSSFSPNLIKQLRMYSWPGNVRELENVIQRMLLVYNGRDNVIRARDVVDCIPRDEVKTVEIDDNIYNLHIIEKQVIKKALNHYKNQRIAAQHLRISESKLRRRIREFGIVYSKSRKADVEIKSKQSPWQKQQRQLILDYLDEHSEITTPDAVQLLGNVARKTAIARLNELIERGKLKRSMRGKYVQAKPLDTKS